MFIRQRPPKPTLSFYFEHDQVNEILLAPKGPESRLLLLCGLERRQLIKCIRLYIFIQYGVLKKCLAEA